MSGSFLTLFPLCAQQSLEDGYVAHLEELKALMRTGVGKQGLPNNQQYNEGGTLTKRPEVK